MPILDVWTDEEQEQLRNLVEKHGTCWAAISREMVNKGPKQCSKKWKRMCLEINQKTDKWSPEEDEALRKAHARLGNQWTKIAEILGGQRSDNAAKNRWWALVKKDEEAATGYSTKRRKHSEYSYTDSPCHSEDNLLANNREYNYRKRVRPGQLAPFATGVGHYGSEPATAHRGLDLTTPLSSMASGSSQLTSAPSSRLAKRLTVQIDNLAAEPPLQTRRVRNGLPKDEYVTDDEVHLPDPAAIGDWFGGAAPLTTSRRETCNAVRGLTAGTPMLGSYPWYAAPLESATLFNAAMMPDPADPNAWWNQGIATATAINVTPGRHLSVFGGFDTERHTPTQPESARRGSHRNVQQLKSSPAGFGSPRSRRTNCNPTRSPH